MPVESISGNCFLWFKDTKMKANHNPEAIALLASRYCFLWFKDTKMKANHNMTDITAKATSTVSYGSKILK